MKIAIVGSMSDEETFFPQFQEAMLAVEKAGHQPIRPDMDVEANYPNMAEHKIGVEKSKWLQKNIQMIENSDAIFVVNFPHKGVKNYIGANTFWEMAIAYYLKKPIYLLNDPNRQQNVFDEVLGMQPIMLNGDMSKI